ncbi:uncharacterized protein H6S33_012737 [Morchella sextelata]|uniref:uncharacterized protein n=1 Tax=Morchella sextelata TaxID=1174677 RepID=UPI001D054EAA|nr:uncharacterized protein H6S33_012737 [Morchella sextelata]KAH0609251.1 hypothetical protein H6S33_012737 [Morchella sextelata]
MSHRHPQYGAHCNNNDYDYHYDNTRTHSPTPPSLLPQASRVLSVSVSKGYSAPSR